MSAIELAKVVLTWLRKEWTLTALRLVPLIWSASVDWLSREAGGCGPYRRHAEVDSVDVGLSGAKSSNIEATTGGDLDEVLEVLDVDVVDLGVGGVDGVDTSVAVLDSSKVVVGVKGRVDHRRVGNGDGGEDESEGTERTHCED